MTRITVTKFGLPMSDGAVCPRDDFRRRNLFSHRPHGGLYIWFFVVLSSFVIGDSSLPLARANDASASDPRPNILLAIADDWSYGHGGAYGCHWVKTPALDHVAREGLLFTRAYTPNAKCAPSRASLLTGRNSWQLKDACNHVCYFPPEFKSYPETLQDRGYFVGFTGKGWGPGVANDDGGQPRRIAGRPFNRRKTRPPARSMSNNNYAGNFEDFLDAVPDEKPWCFWYGAAEPHRAYQYGVGRGQGGKQLADVDRVPGFLPDNDTVRNDLLDYAFEVEHFDRHLERIIELLDRREQLQNTLIVVTGDHGMPFPRCKGQAYDYSNHVPLAIMWGRGITKPGRVVDDYVSFIDLAPTFIEVAGLTWRDTGMKPTPGRSLTDIFASQASGRVNAGRDHVLVGKERHDVGRPHDWGYPIRGIVKDDMLYLRNFETSRWPAGNPETGYLNCDGSPSKTVVLNGRTMESEKQFWQLCFGKRPEEELYDLKSDPDCLTNLAGSGEHGPLKERLRGQLLDELKSQHDPRILGQSDYFDTLPYANTDTRNFHERYLRGEPIRAGWVNESDFESAPLD